VFPGVLNVFPDVLFSAVNAYSAEFSRIIDKSFIIS